MTREEELDWLCRLRSEIYVYMPKEWLIPMNNALDMAIKALEQEPCDDTISRQAVIDACEQSINILEAVDRIMDLPSVEQEPKTGHWIAIDEEPHEVWECDHCGFVIDGSGCIDPYDYLDTYKFCPNCGARMESEDKE